MVINKKKHSDKNRAKQGAEEVTAEPNKIGAATHYDFEARNLTAYGGLLPVAAMLEKLGFQQLVEEALTVKRITRTMPMYQFVLAMVLAGLRRVFAASSSAISGAGADADGHPESVAAAAAVHLLAVSGVAASGGGAATAGGAAAHAGTRVGGGPCPTVGGDAGYRHHRAHPVRQPDGRAQELQPEEQREEELPADPDVSGRDTGIRKRRVAQGGSAHRRADCAPSGERVRSLAAASEDDSGPRRFGFLLWGGSRGLREEGRAIHRLGAQNVPAGGGAESGRLEAIAAHRCRWSVRVSISTGRLGESLPVHRRALREEAQAERGR